MAVLFECQKPCRFQITKEKNIPLSPLPLSHLMWENMRREAYE